MTESDIRRIFREELALALNLYTPKEPPSTSAKFPTPALNAVREMSQREKMEAIVRSPDPVAMAKELFKRRAPHPRGKKAAA